VEFILACLQDSTNKIGPECFRHAFARYTVRILAEVPIILIGVLSDIARFLQPNDGAKVK
jgi:hypothetical protein